MRSKYLIFLFLLTSMVYSQVDSLRIFKTHSVQFRTSNLLSLSSFKGSFLSYKYHPNDDHAYRFGISLNGRESVEDEKIDNYQYSDTSLFDQTRNTNYLIIDIMVEYLKYFRLKEELKMYFGLGPRVNLTINDYDTDKVQYEGYSFYKEQKNDRYRFGLTFSYGLEWFFRKNMSLHAEYGFTFSYLYEEYSNWRIYPHDNDPDGFIKNTEVRKGFELDDTGALLGLSLYF